MPQLILPIIPQGAAQINGQLCVVRNETSWTYFLSTYPICSHKKDDHLMFRLITAQLIETGICRQIDIQKPFGVSKSSVIRSAAKLRKGGIEAFFTPRKGRRGGCVFTPDILEQAQQLLNQGHSKKDAAEKLGTIYDTFRKAVNDSRLIQTKDSEAALSKSSRNVVDSAAADGMATGCTGEVERVPASLGKMAGAPVRFENAWMFLLPAFFVRFRRCWQTDF